LSPLALPGFSKSGAVLKVKTPVSETMETEEASSPETEYVRVSPSASEAVTVPIAVVFSSTAIVPTAVNVGALFAGGVGGVGGVGVELPPPPPPPPHEAIKIEVKTIESNLFCIVVMINYIKKMIVLF